MRELRREFAAIVNHWLVAVVALSIATGIGSAIFVPSVDASFVERALATCGGIIVGLLPVACGALAAVLIRRLLREYRTRHQETSARARVRGPWKRCSPLFRGDRLHDRRWSCDLRRVRPRGGSPFRRQGPRLFRQRGAALRLRWKPSALRRKWPCVKYTLVPSATL